jgi:hypothetical protein
VADHDGHTVDVGHVHTPEFHGGPCRPTCPHPDHQTSTANARLTEQVPE